MPIFVTHRRQQWPVGHGFFHTASLKVGDEKKTYRYIYDCGSASRSLIEERVDDFLDNEDLELRDEEIDMLVLSHFHADHINGVPRLLERNKIKKLVLPFLSTDFKLAILADLANTGLDIWKEFSGLVLDPQEWMRSRNQADVQLTIIRADTSTDRDNNLNSTPNEGFNLPLGNINHDVNGTICSSGIEFWDFRFYVNENLERYFFLLGALFEKFIPSSEDELLNWLSDPDWIASNQLCITEIFRSLGPSNQNGITLCMYSGPAPSREIYCGSNLTNHGLVNQGQRFSHFRFPDFREWDEKKLGWLGTGDAELRGQSFFDAFVEHYRRYIDAVDTLTIPHHGSIKNYCGALGEIGQCAVLTSDHMNDPKGFHPSKKVMLNLRTKCRDIFIVTRNMESAVFSTTEVVLN